MIDPTTDPDVEIYLADCDPARREEVLILLRAYEDGRRSGAYLGAPHRAIVARCTMGAAYVLLHASTYGLRGAQAALEMIHAIAESMDNNRSPILRPGVRA